MTNSFFSLPEQQDAFRYRELDAFRGAAALGVVIFHLTMGQSEADLGFKLGTTGVDLFFIISGFVISMSISKVSTGSEFIINRVSRLYPTYWTSVTFTFIIILLYSTYKNESVNWIAYAGNMTMFQYYLGLPDLDGPYWTMIVELNFYAFILVLFYLGYLRHIIPVGVLLLSGITVMSIFHGTAFVKKIFEIIPLLEFFPLFFAGVIFFRIVNNIGLRSIHYILILSCLILQIAMFNIAGKSRAFINQFEYTMMLLVFFGSFILFVNGKMKFIVKRPLLFLGKISFALYLTHQYLLIGHLLPLLFKRYGLNFWIAAIICLVVAIVIATLITFFIEVPFSGYLKRKLKTQFLNPMRS